MPAVLAPVLASSLVSAGVSAATANIAGTVLAYVAITGASVGPSHLLRRPS